MDGREARRRSVARQVMKLQRVPHFRDALAVAADGSRPVVIALADDTVESMFRLVAAAGGTATVVAPGLGGVLDIIPVKPDTEHGPITDDDCPLHPDTHVDMLVTYLRRQDRPVRCDVVARDYGFGVVQEFQDA